MKKIFLSILIFASAFSYGQVGNPFLKKYFNIDYYGAKGDLKRIYDGTMGATSNTFTSSTANFTASDVGKAIRVPRAAGSGLDLVTTISAFTNSTTVSLTAASVGAVSTDTVVYGTDNTAAIQRAIWADSLNNGGVIWVPNKPYLVAGPLITSAFGGNPNSQLYFPISSYAAGPPQFFRRTHYVIEGESPPNFLSMSFVDTLSGLNGSIIYSIIDGTGTFPSVFGTKGYSGSFNNLSFNYFTFKNLTIMVAQNINGGGPTMTGVNMYYSASASADNVLITADGSITRSVQPTNEAAGWISSSVQSEIQSKLSTLQTSNFKYGMIISDDALIENGIAFICQYGLVISANVENVQVNHMKVYWCNNDVYFPNATVGGMIPAGACYFNITNLVTEVFSGSGKWYDYSYIVNDAGNHGTGDINYTVIQAAGTWANNLYNVNGGSHIQSHQIGKVPNAGTIDAVLTAGNTTAVPMIETYNYSGTNFGIGTGRVQGLLPNNTSFGDNFHYNGSLYKYDTTGGASWFQHINGSIAARLAVSGATGGTISPLNAMALNSDLSGGIGGNGTVLGSANYWINWTTAGALNLKHYGSGSNTGTAAYALNVDASGNIIEGTVGGGGGLSGLTTGQVAFATSSTTVGGDAALFWDNTKKTLGIGFSTPTTAYEVQNSISNSDGATNIPGFIAQNTNATIANGSSTYNFSSFTSSAGNGTVSAQMFTEYGPGATAPFSTGTGGYIGTRSNHPFYFFTNGAVVGSFAATGALNLKNYGAGTFSGTPTYNLLVNSSGNVIETATGVSNSDGATNVPGYLTQNLNATLANGSSTYNFSSFTSSAGNGTVSAQMFTEYGPGATAPFSNGTGGYIGTRTNHSLFLYTNGAVVGGLAPSGAMRLNNYGSGTFTGTATKALNVDASGNIIEGTVGGGGMTNPLTTTGDIIYSSSGTTPARLGIGSTNQVLTVTSGIPAWGSVLTSATYTPSLTNTTNISSSTLTQAVYSRVGNIITVTISVAITPTASSTATTLTVALPLTTSVTSQSGIGGGVLALNAGGLGYIGCYASVSDATHMQIYCTPTTTSSSNISITCQYTL